MHLNEIRAKILLYQYTYQFRSKVYSTTDTPQLRSYRLRASKRDYGSVAYVRDAPLIITNVYNKTEEGQCSDYYQLITTDLIHIVMARGKFNVAIQKEAMQMKTINLSCTTM